MIPARGPGLQMERTALARQRTALALIAGGAVLARLTFDQHGPWALAGPAVTIPLALWVFLESRRHFQHDGLVRTRSGRSPLMLTFATASLALTELTGLALGPS